MKIKLTEAEFVLIHIAGKWPQARRVMKKKTEEYEKVGFFLELDLLTRCLVVLLTGSSIFEKMTEDIYKNKKVLLSLYVTKTPKL